jgi:small conductance mechanosensitive channel
MPPWEASVQTWFAQFIGFVPRLVTAFVVLLITIVASGWAGRAARAGARRRAAAPEIGLLLERMARWGVFSLGLLLALEQLQLDLTSLIAGLGIVGLTLGFALGDIAKNLVAGFLLLLQQPFRIGDAIEVAGFGGRVEDITLRTTQVRTWDGRHVLIPNADVYVSPIVNLRQSPRRRIEVQVGVAYESDLARATEVALRAVQSLAGVIDEPAPLAVSQRFGDSGVELLIQFWVDTGKIGLLEAQDAAIQAVKRALDDENIRIPYPTRMMIQPQA